MKKSTGFRSELIEKINDIIELLKEIPRKGNYGIGYVEGAIIDSHKFKFETAILDIEKYILNEYFKLNNNSVKRYN